MKNNLVKFEDKYDEHFGRNTHFYSITAMGKIALQITNNYFVKNVDPGYFIQSNNSTAIKDLVENSTNLLDDEERSWNNKEPLIFCKLTKTFYDQPFMAAIKRMGVKFSITEENTSDQRLENIFDKRCNVAVIPKTTIDEYFKNNPRSTDLVVLRGMRQKTPTQLVKSTIEMKDVYYSGGSSRKKRAQTVSEKTVEVDSRELLKGIADGDFDTFVSNEQDVLPLQFEDKFTIDRIFYDDALIVTNRETVEKGNSFIRKIFRQHNNVFMYGNNRNLLMKEAIPYVAKDLLKHVRKNPRSFKQLNTILRSELL